MLRAAPTAHALRYSCLGAHSSFNTTVERAFEAPVPTPLTAFLARHRQQRPALPDLHFRRPVLLRANEPVRRLSERCKRGDPNASGRRDARCHHSLLQGTVHHLVLHGTSSDRHRGGRLE
eukprot:6173021-Pleurochrysis_carterae.AAC.3